MNADVLRAAWTGALDQVGPITSIGTPASETGPGGTVVKVPMQGERGALTFVVSVAASGHLTGLQLAPPEAMDAVAPWDPPAYADPSRFDEEELTLGSEPVSVPATLSLPRRAGPPACRRPACRIGAAGPRRDGRPQQAVPRPGVGPGEPGHRRAALRQGHARAPRRGAGQARLHDERRVPAAGAGRDRAAAGAPGRRSGAPLRRRAQPRRHRRPARGRRGTGRGGLVILGGGAAPLHWVIVRQLRYIASLDPATAAAAEPGIQALSRQAERVDDPNLSPETPASEMPLGTPAPYWLDLRDYDAPAAAAVLGKPILLLQGGRDYQSTVDDDLVRWKAALARQPGTTIRILPADDHFFFPGSGPSGPQGTMAPGQHVDPDVIDEIAGWLDRRGAPA